MNVPLQLLSWNVHGVPFSRARRQRLQRVGRTLLERRPDLALLQEVWLPADAELLLSDLGDAYQPVDVPRGGLLGRLGGLLTLVRRDSGWQVEGTIFQPFSRSGALWKVWQGDGVGRKGVQRVDLQSASGRLAVLNTHLQSDYRWNDYAAIRASQLSELQRVAEEVDEPVPVLAAGDLNTRPKETLYTDLRRFWFDLTEATRGQTDSGTCLNPNGSDAGWIDYVLMRQNPAWHVEFTSVQRIVNSAPDQPFSDHHGLDVTVRIAPAKLEACGLKLEA